MAPKPVLRFYPQTFCFSIFGGGPGICILKSAPPPPRRFQRHQSCNLIAAFYYLNTILCPLALSFKVHPDVNSRCPPIGLSTVFLLPRSSPIARQLSPSPLRAGWAARLVMRLYPRTLLPAEGLSPSPVPLPNPYWEALCGNASSCQSQLPRPYLSSTSLAHSAACCLGTPVNLEPFVNKSSSSPYPGGRVTPCDEQQLWSQTSS